MNTSSRRLVASALTFGLGLLWGCSTDTITNQPVPSFIPNPALTGGNGIVFPLFDTTTFQLPLPNDVLRNPGTAPGQAANRGLIDFPNVSNFSTEPFVSMETIRGFSTTGNIIIPFSGRIDAASVTPQSLLLVEGASSTVSPETAGANVSIPYTVTVRNPDPSTTGNSTIVMTPLRPLKPATNYYVTMTTAIQGNGRSIGTAPIMQASKSRDPLTDAAGNNNIFPVPQDTALTLEGLRTSYQPFWARAESILGTDRANIPIVFRFGTEPELAALATLRGATAANVSTDTLLPDPALAYNAFVPAVPNPAQGAVNANDTLLPGSVDAFYNATNPANSSTLGNIGTVPHGSINRISTGTIKVNNYYGPNGFWRGEGFPGLPPIQLGDSPNQTVRRPFRCCLPAGPGPFPVVIYQHGVGRSKDDIFLIANDFCAQGQAVIAIDLVFHGPAATAFPPVPAGATPELAFFNLSNPRAARDNFRQSAVNLHYLTQSIVNFRTDVDANPTNGFPAAQIAIAQPGIAGVTGSDLNPAAIRFVGHSLGGIVGGVYTATEPANQRAVLSAAGGRLIPLGFNSATRGPVFRQLLAQNSGGVLVPGSQALELFQFASQTVLDDGDPINYAAAAIQGYLKSANPAEFAARSSRVVVQEMINDQTIPNSSTRDLATAFAYDSNAFNFNAARPTTFRHVQLVLDVVATLTAVPAPYLGPDASGLSQFTGGHEGLLGQDPVNVTPAATVTSMRNQINQFFLAPTHNIVAQ